MSRQSSSASSPPAPAAGCTSRRRSSAPICSSSGSCGRGVFGRAMLGDDTRAALNGAPCAVAIAAHGYASNPPRSPTSVSPTTPRRRAAQPSRRLEKLARATGAAVHALEVVSIPSATYTGFMPPAIGESIDEMLQQANDRLQSCPAPMVARCMASPARSSLRSATRWTSSSSARAAMARCGVWCSAAPPPTSSATHAARCSCCPAHDRHLTVDVDTFTAMTDRRTPHRTTLRQARRGTPRRRSGSCSPTITRSCAAACGCCSTASPTSRWSPRPATSRAPGATCAATIPTCWCST